MKRLLKTTLAAAAAGFGLLASSAAFAFPEPYCVRGYSSGVEPITLVDIDGIHNVTAAPTGGTADEDFTAILGQLAPGGTYPVTLSGNSDGAFVNAYAVYIDWDHSGTFEAPESYFIGTITGSTGVDGKTVGGQIAVPAGATLGNTRMRVAKQYTSATAPGLVDVAACGTAGFGQAEDYTVNVDPAAPVPPSLAKSFSPVNSPAGTVSRLTLTLGNTNAGAISLTADLTDTLPAGLFLGTPANASTTCSGTLTAVDGTSSVTLASGASLPVGGCTIGVDTVAPAGGVYVNAIAAGAMQTTVGNGPAATATYQATQAGVITYGTGFETPFTVGAINGQQGWSARSVNVAATAPANGAQHLAMTATASPTANNYALAISPDAPVGTTTYALLSANLRMSHTTNGANWRFNPQDPAAGLVTTIVQFERSASQKIQVVSFAGGTGTMLDTGASWPADTYFNMKVIVQRATGALKLCVDNVEIYNDPSGNGTAGRNIADVALSQLAGSGNTAGNTFYADDIVIDNTNIGSCDGSIATHTVTPSVGTPSGTITPDTAQAVTDGATASFTLTPDAGFHIDTVGGTCGGSLAGSVYTTNAVTADCTVVANFAADGVITHVVTPGVGTPSGTITPDTAQTVNDGATTSFTLAPDAGFHVDTVGGTCGGSLAGDVFTTDAVTADCTVVANFAADAAGGAVCSGPINHAIGSDINGTSVNWLTGDIVDADPSSGYDINLYNSGGLRSWWNDAPAISAGVAATTASADYTVLQVGAVIGAGSTWSRTNGAMTAFQAGTDGYLGFRFDCSSIGGTECYGYAHLTTTGTTGFPATLVDYCYDPSGASITIAGGGATTHVVTPSVGTPSGTITPDTAQTVNDGATATFTLTADAGFHIDTVGGTCGGTLAGNDYTTNAVTADCTVVANFAADGGGSNGVILSGLLNHAIQATTAGTSLNIVTSAFDDAGPISGDWDFNFWSSSNNLTAWIIGTHNATYAVDGSGKALALHNGDTVGPSSTFSTSSGSVAMVAEWLAGTNAALGVKFDCDGRLAFPVAGGVCYGYVHMSTTGPTGFAALIVDTAFDGDGNAITVAGLPVLNPPSASVAPSSLSFSVAANATATDTIAIANAAGSSPLTWSVTARGTTSAPVLRAHTRSMDAARRSKATSASSANIEPKLQELQSRHAAFTSGNRRFAHNAPAPWNPVGSIQFVLDDGSYETSVGWTDQASDTEFSAVWVNRFNATTALTVDSVSIMWPQNNGGTLVGRQVNIVAYYDADADGDPSNAVRLGTDNLQTIASLDAFLTYATNFSVPGAGDVYIGFFNGYANGGTTPAMYPAAIDQASDAGMSWVAANNTGDGNVDIGANDTIGTIGDLSAGTLTGNWLIRATGSGGGGGGSCTGAVVTWLTATPSGGSVNGGGSTSITVTANPAAGSLGEGSYTAELCFTTNDPVNALIAVPVSLTVTAAPFQACSGGADQLFCDGFDGTQSGGGNVVTGTINQAVAPTGDGSSLDFALGDFHGYNASITSDDINLYTLGLPAISVYWYGDMVPAEFADVVGGVVATPGGTDFRVLHSGDTIGPDSPVSAASQGADMSAFQGGVDGYIGVAFYNETTAMLNFGYLHVTTSPGGFPIQALDYGYDTSGAAITIP